MAEGPATKSREPASVSVLGVLGVIIGVLMVFGSVAFYAADSGVVRGGQSSVADESSAATTGSGATR